MQGRENPSEHSIELEQGYGVIKFGFSPDDVQHYLGGPNESEILDTDGTTVMWHYTQLELQIIFQKPWPKPAVASLDIPGVFQLSASHPRSTLWGKEIIGLTEGEVRTLFKEQGYSEFIETVEQTSSMNFRSLQLKGKRVHLCFADDVLSFILWGPDLPVSASRTP